MKHLLSRLQTETFTAQREWTAEGIPVLTAAVSLPRPAAAEGRTARRIQRYYQLQCRCFLRYCETFLFPQATEACRLALAASAPLPRCRAELSYRVTWNGGGLWSLYTQSREVLPGTPTLLRRRGDTWDLSSGYPAPLSAFFPAGWKKRLLTHAQAEIRRQEALGEARFREDWRRQLRRCFNARDYYLTEEGLTFFYPMYALAPAAEGIPTFLLPYGEMGPFPPCSDQKPDL